MSFKHILVAVDLTNESHALVAKAVGLARALNAEVSLIHVNLAHGDIYPGEAMRQDLTAKSGDRTTQESQNVLNILKENAGYPISHTLVGTGNIQDEIEEAIWELNIDLVVCGHHQTFWHSIISSAKQLIRAMPVELLIIPIREE